MSIRVFVTRPLAQSQTLLDQLNQRGFSASHFPIMAIQPDETALRALPKQVENVNWLLFVSPSAIDIAWPTLAPLAPFQQKLACIGASSAKTLAKYTKKTVYYPLAGSDSESLLALPEFRHMQQQSVLIIRGHGGRDLLADTLRKRGANVAFAQCYHRIDGAPDWADFDRTTPTAIIITSGSMVEQLFRLAGTSRHALLQSVLYCVPHTRVAAALSAQGAKHILTTAADDMSLVNGLYTWFSRRL